MTDVAAREAFEEWKAAAGGWDPLHDNVRWEAFTAGRASRDGEVEGWEKRLISWQDEKEAMFERLGHAERQRDEALAQLGSWNEDGDFSDRAADLEGQLADARAEAQRLREQMKTTGTERDRLYGEKIEAMCGEMERLREERDGLVAAGEQVRIERDWERTHGVEIARRAGYAEGVEAAIGYVAESLSNSAVPTVDGWADTMRRALAAPTHEEEGEDKGGDAGGAIQYRPPSRYEANAGEQGEATFVPDAHKLRPAPPPEEESQ